jgi:ribosomal protein S18 acetylase RimI-like enzyme
MLTSIRTAERKDAPKIAAGEYETAKIRGLLNALPGEIPEAPFLEKITACQSGELGLYVVAELGSELVGHLLLDPLPLKANAHVCTLNLVIYPGWRGRGIGRALLAHGIRWACSNPRVEKIELLVRATNERAIKLYRSLGFTEEGVIHRRVKESCDVYFDDIAMALFVE